MLSRENARVVDRACEIIGAAVLCYLWCAVVLALLMAPFQIWAAVRDSDPIFIGYRSWWPPLLPAFLLLWWLARKIATHTQKETV